MDSFIVGALFVLSLTTIGIIVYFGLREFPRIERKENKAIVNGGNGIAKISVETLAELLNQAHQRLDEQEKTFNKRLDDQRREYEKRLAVQDERLIDCEQDRFKLRLEIQTLKKQAEERGWKDVRNTIRIDFIASLRKLIHDYLSQTELSSMMMDLGYQPNNYVGAHADRVNSFLGDANNRGNQAGSILDVTKWIRENRPDIDLERM